MEDGTTKQPSIKSKENDNTKTKENKKNSNTNEDKKTKRAMGEDNLTEIVNEKNGEKERYNNNNNKTAHTSLIFIIFNNIVWQGVYMVYYTHNVSENGHAALFTRPKRKIIKNQK